MSFHLNPVAGLFGTY